MPRIRSIKPEFFLNEELALLTPLARLLFIGLWTTADRAGRLGDRSRRIKGQLFPYENVDVEEILSELDSHGFISRYEIDNTKYIQIVNFLKHQKPHPREAVSIIPGPDGNREAVAPGRETAEPSRVDRGMVNGSGNGSGNDLPREPGSDDALDDISARYAIEELETGERFIACDLPTVLVDLFPDLPFPEFYRKWWLSRVAKGGIGRRSGMKATLRQYCADIESFFGSCDEIRKRGGKQNYESASEKSLRNLRASCEQFDIGIPANSEQADSKDPPLLISTGSNT